MLKLTDYIGLGAAEYSGELIGLRLSTRLHIGKGAKPSWKDVIISGVSPLALTNALGLNYIKALGATEQRNLPNNYIQRQFIYMMDGSYLLTDIVPTYDCKIEMDFQTTTLPSGSVYFLGGRTETYGGIFFARSTGGVITVDAFGTSSNDRYTSNVSFSNNTRYKFTFNNKDATLESGGTTLFTNTFTGENANGAALCINGLNSSGTTSGAQTGIYLYSFKAWNNQGQLIADYVPAVQKGTVPVVGFYDTVSGTFKTATSGTFAAGGEAVPTPENPMDIICNNGVVKVSKNLFNVNDLNNGSYQDDTNTKRINAKINIGSAGYYTCSLSNNIENFEYIVSTFRKNTKTFVGNITTWTNQTNTIQISAVDLSAYDYVFTFRRANETSINKDAFTGYFQIEAGSVATPYHPYRQIYADGTVETINVYGKNLFDYSIGLQFGSDPTVVWTTTSAGVTFALNQATGLYTVSGTSASSGGRNTLRTQTFYLSAGTYTMQVTNNPAIQVVLVNETTGNTIADNLGGRTFTLTETTPLHFGLARTVGITYDDEFYLQIEQGSTATDYEPYFNGGTATTEMLLAIDTYQDNQELLTGNVTRNIGIKVLDGTENWQAGTGQYTGNFYVDGLLDNAVYPTDSTKGTKVICSHFTCVTTLSNFTSNKIIVTNAGGGRTNLWSDKTNVDAHKQYLVDQYVNGTPVIIIYPLATPTTETVSGQSLTASGNCTVTATGSINNLSLEVSYRQGV